MRPAAGPLLLSFRPGTRPPGVHRYTRIPQAPVTNGGPGVSS